MVGPPPWSMPGKIRDSQPHGGTSSTIASAWTVPRGTRSGHTSSCGPHLYVSEGCRRRAVVRHPARQVARRVTIEDMLSVEGPGHAEVRLPFLLLRQRLGWGFALYVNHVELQGWVCLSGKCGENLLAVRAPGGTLSDEDASRPAVPSETSTRNPFFCPSAWTTATSAASGVTPLKAIQRP